MDVKIPFKGDLVDVTSNIPMPHLSFIINFLLPKHLVGIKRTDKLFKNFKIAVENDPTFSDGFLKPILVGSSAESYNIPDTMRRVKPLNVQTMADADILLQVSGLAVETEDNESFSESEEKKLILDHENVHPGYCRLQLRKAPKGDDETIVFDDVSQKYYFSGQKLQAKILNVLSSEENTQIHGPAVSEHVQKSTPEIFRVLKSGSRTQIHDQDYVCALRCRKWPGNAKSWIKRQENDAWLSPDQIHAIVEKGIHLVPVAHKLSQTPEFEWRLSFAEAEVYLSHNAITDEQRQCYVFLKIIYYKALKQLEVLSSYHLKTVFLYSCEQLPRNVWIENMGSCLLYLIDTLIGCVKSKFLPSFFIPENNLIDHLSDSEASKVLEILKVIREFPLHPVLEFTDVNVLGMQSLSTPFREIMSPVLEDMVDFLTHKNIQRTVTHAFPSALFKIVYVLALEGKPKESVRYVVDICPIINKHSPGFTSVAQIIDSVAMGFIKDIQLTVNLLEEALKYSDDHPDVLLLRGNLACMFHALAYTHPVDSEERIVALIQAETLFNTVVDVEDIHSPTTVDFCCLLINQKRFDEAAEKLDRFIEAEMKKTGSMHCFYKKEATVLDETIQKEVKIHGKFSVNSLSMAYYLLVKCVVKNDLKSADTAVYQKILQYFTVHCDKLNESSSFSLLGYARMIVEDYSEAIQSFDKAMSTLDGNARLIRENIELCELKLSV